MIPSSRLVGLICLVTAAGLHAAAFLPETSETPPAIEGRAGATVAMQGNSFADMAEGIAAPEPVTETVEPVVVDKTPEPEVEATVEPVDVVETPSVETQAANLRTPRIPVVSPIPEHTPSLASTPEIIVANPERAPANARRPAPRPRTQNRRHEPPPVTRGNAQQNARAGEDEGRPDAQVTRSGTETNGRTTESGNAAAANYPGQIRRRIARTRRQSVNVRGSAFVTFTIAQNGGLTSVGIARSSGSSALDRAAVRQVQRAVPFPPPPAGARRTYTIEIKGR